MIPLEINVHILEIKSRKRHVHRRWLRSQWCDVLSLPQWQDTTCSLVNDLTKLVYLWTKLSFLFLLSSSCSSRLYAKLKLPLQLVSIKLRGSVLVIVKTELTEVVWCRWNRQIRVDNTNVCVACLWNSKAGSQSCHNQSAYGLLCIRIKKKKFKTQRWVVCLGSTLSDRRTNAC